jgi:hypothetical protein
VALSPMAKMLSALVPQSELDRLKKVIGTPKVGDVLETVATRCALRKNLQVYSGLVVLAAVKGKKRRLLWLKRHTS